MSLTLYTSGSTDKPKLVTHSWDYINRCAQNSVTEVGLTKDDIVLDVFPANTIAHYTVTGLPAFLSGAQYVCSNFNAYTYPTLFNRVKPTYISLIPRHLELLNKTKDFKDLDMSCVRYMVAGSSKITQEFIDTFKSKGVQTIANWYGMTEYPPPILIGYNSTKFNLHPVSGDHVMYHPISATNKLAECIINGKSTGDIFDTSTQEFSHRRKEANGKTWKTDV
jgi:fatty-acyl-CoA synthase